MRADSTRNVAGCDMTPIPEQVVAYLIANPHAEELPNELEQQVVAVRYANTMAKQAQPPRCAEPLSPEKRVALRLERRRLAYRAMKVNKTARAI